MTFKDILKKSFLEGYARSEFSVGEIVMCFLITAIIGAYIFVIYRLVTKRTFYDHSFNVSLPLMAIATSAVILTIQSSVVVSLGMVGALSIVRFRTAVKNPIDLVFLFWSISCGIICGAGLATIAVLLSAVMTVVILVLNAVPNSDTVSLLVVNAVNAECESRIMNIVSSHSKIKNISAQTLTRDELDMVIEVKPDNATALLKEILSADGITSASIVKHNGDVTF